MGHRGEHVNDLSAADVRGFLVEFFAPDLTAHGLDPQHVDLGLDLVQSGIVDSTGILEMVLALQERFGFEIDLEELAVDEMVAIGPLAEFVADQARRAPAVG
jgi:acyl carrier protein